MHTQPLEPSNEQHDAERRALAAAYRFLLKLGRQAQEERARGAQRDVGEAKVDAAEAAR